MKITKEHRKHRYNSFQCLVFKLFKEGFFSQISLINIKLHNLYYDFVRCKNKTKPFLCKYNV